MPRPALLLSISDKGGTICAERTAIVKAVVRGGLSKLNLCSFAAERRYSLLHRARSRLVRRLSAHLRPTAYAAPSPVASALSPCGICRQVIREFCSLDMPILLVPADYSATAKTGEQGAVLELTLEALLPHSFGPEHLELPRSG